MASKRARVESRVGRFVSEDAEKAYDKMKEKCGITISKTLRQDKLQFPISDLFSQTTLMFILTLAYPFHSDFLYEFFANLSVNSTYTILTSRISNIDIEISKDDLFNLLSISKTGPSAHCVSYDPTFSWTRINQIIRNTNLHQHHHSVTGLVQNARIIQHVLRHTIIPKAGDRTNITPLLSLVTYYCMSHTPFDEADLLIRYIDNLSIIRDPKVKKKQNLALGHLLSYIIQMKYAIGNSIEPDILPSYFTDHSFHTLYGGKKHKQPIEEEEEEEEGGNIPQGESSAPPPPPPSGDWVERFQRLEVRLDHHIEDSTARWIQWEQRHEEDRAWFQAQFDSLRGHFPPPDQGSSSP